MDNDKCICGDKRKDHQKRGNIWRGCNKCLCTSFMMKTEGMWTPRDDDLMPGLPT